LRKSRNSKTRPFKAIFAPTDNDKNSAMKKVGNFRMLLRNLRKRKEQEEQEQALVLSNVSKSFYCLGDFWGESGKCDNQCKECKGKILNQ
jgi:hypothetical protein